MIAIEAGRYDVPGSHLSANVNLWPRPLVVFANADAFSGLTDDERRILREAAASVVPRMAMLQRHSDAEIAGNVCRRERMTFDSASPAELRALRAAVEPVYRDLERDPATPCCDRGDHRAQAAAGRAAGTTARLHARGSARGAGPDPPRRDLADGLRAQRRRAGLPRRELGSLDLRVRPRALRHHAGESERPAPGVTGPTRSTARRRPGGSSTAAARRRTARRTSRASSSPTT